MHRAAASFMLLALSVANLTARAESSSMHSSRADIPGQVLVVQESLNRVEVFPAEHPEALTIIPVGEKPHEIELSADRKTAFVSNFGLLEANHKVGTPGTTISVIDIAAKRERTRFQLPEGMRAPHGLKVRPQHSDELFTNAEEGREAMVVFHARSGSILRTFPLPAGVHNFIFSEDGADCYAFTIAGSVLRLDPMTGKILAQVSVPFVRGLAWTADRRQLLVGARGKVLLLDPQQLGVTRVFSDLSVGQTFYVGANPEGVSFLAPAVLDGVLLVINAQTGAVEKRIATGSPLQAVFQGKYAWVSNVKVPASMLPPGSAERPGGLVRLDLSTFEFQLIPGTEDANGLAVIP